MQIKFHVEGHLPPKKDGASSMWKKLPEIPRIVELRRAALAALAGRPPLQRSIGITLRVYVGTTNDRSTGDLDNFVTGVCDGLMAAAPRIPWHGHATWQDPRNESIRPDRCVAIVDDAQVVEIRASKVQGKHPTPWYEIELSDDVVVA